MRDVDRYPHPSHVTASGRHGVTGLDRTPAKPRHDARCVVCWPDPEPGDPCRCGHPLDHHEMTDDEPGACYSTATMADPDGTCWCDLFARPVEESLPAEELPR